MFRNRSLVELILAVLLLLPKTGNAEPIVINQEWLNSRSPSPYYLDQADANYILATDLSAKGTALAIIAAGITLDLNGQTITYDNQDPIEIPNASFEEGSGRSAPGWNFSEAMSAEVGDGPFSGRLAWSGPQALRFLIPGDGSVPEQQCVSATSPVGLESNTTYDLSLRIYNAIPEGTTIRVYAELEGRDVEAGLTGRTWRGFQFTTASFTTGANSENVQIRLCIAGATAALEKAGYVYVDDIRIQSTRVYGIVAGPQNWSEDWVIRNYPDINRFGRADNAVIKNGTIRQGQGSGNRSHAVYAFRADNIEITDIESTVHGPNSHNFGSYYATGAKIHSNTFYNNVDLISSRDSFDGTVVSAGSNGSVFNNTIIGGCQNGIVARSSMLIYENIIKLRARYTNGFAVQLYGDSNSQVYSNTIRCGEGDFACRGIFVGGGAQGTKIFNNDVEVQELPINQEYGGGQGGSNVGSYGIQVESSNDISIYGNKVSALAREWTASAFRMNANLTDRGIHVYNNTFRALKLGRGDFPDGADVNRLTANCVKIDGGIDSSQRQLRFENNKLFTNSRWIACSGISNLEFSNTTLNIEGELLNPFQPLTAIRYQSDATGAITDLRFLNPQFASTAARQAFFDTSIYKKFYTNFGIDPYSSFRVSWPLTVRVIESQGAPLIGAAIQINDSGNNEIFSGSTDSTGRIQAILDQFSNSGGQKLPAEQETHYLLSVRYPGFEQLLQTINATEALNLTVVLGADPLAPAPPSKLRLKSPP